MWRFEWKKILHVPLVFHIQFLRYQTSVHSITHLKPPHVILRVGYGYGLLQDKNFVYYSMSGVLEIY